MSVVVERWMDYAAFSGYSAIFAFSLYKLQDTFNNAIDLLGNVLLIMGLAALIRFHYVKITTGKNVDTDKNQKNTRLIAHFCVASFFLTTLAPSSGSTYRLYDNFGLLGHLFLLYAVFTGQRQLVGVILLAFYFIGATYRKTQVMGSGLNPENLNLLGRVLLLTYFIVESGLGVSKIVA